VHSKTLDLLTTYQLIIMKILVLIFGVVSSDGQIELIKIPISEALSDITCEKALDKFAKFNENPQYTVGNNEVWGQYYYKNKPVVLHYCTENEGEDGK